MNIIKLIQSKKLDEYYYATLIVNQEDWWPPSAEKKELFIANVGEIIRICQKHNTNIKISTNVNAINSIRLTFDWRCLWYNAGGIKAKNWGDELDALLDVCRINDHFIHFVIQDEMVGYELGNSGEIKEKYKIEEGGE